MKNQTWLEALSSSVIEALGDEVPHTIAVHDNSQARTGKWLAAKFDEASAAARLTFSVVSEDHPVGEILA